MKLILNENVESLGRIGDLVTVKDGYARNFLLPKGLGVIANERNKKALERQIATLEKKREQALAEAKKLASEIEKTSVTVTKQVGEDERIFGTVTTAELEALLAEEGLKISRKQIKLAEEIKKVGVYSAEVHLQAEVNAKFKVWVVAE